MAVTAAQLAMLLEGIDWRAHGRVSDRGLREAALRGAGGAVGRKLSF